MDINFFIYSFVSLFITVDPVGLLPIIHSLLIPYDEKDRKKIIKKAIFVSTIILMIFAIFGKYIFDYFGITIYSFKVAGGLLLFKISWDMLQAEIPKTKHKPDEKIIVDDDIDSIVYVPLAIPLISGPGAITTTMILISKSKTIFDKLIVILSIVYVMLISLIIMYFSDKILKRINIHGVNAFVRIMGLLLMAISVQIIFSGILGLYGIL